MRDAYVALHRLGHAHSVEAYDDGRLVGGIYGVAIGRLFFGESMFSAASGGSTVALAALAPRLRQWAWRSAARRVGDECVGPCRSLGWLEHSKIKNHTKYPIDHTKSTHT